MTDPMSNQAALVSRRLEALLVARNPRGMALVRDALAPAYCLRAARALLDARDDVIICTGFPVADTFETDGPAGALAVYEWCERSGLKPWLLAGAPLINALGEDYRAHAFHTFDREEARREAQGVLDRIKPSLIIFIERPGAATDGHYYNIAGVDITAACRPAEPYAELATCPVIAIGDGGNEIGMAKAGNVLAELDIHPACSGCDELIVADVSNWGAYGLIAMADALRGDPVIPWLDTQGLLDTLVAKGAVDGVTHARTATEDGLPQEAGTEMIAAIRELFAAPQVSALNEA